ncbi:putative multidrug ABC transporter permease YbhS [bioreactor metagenome]|uniref:Putative multidrug ABC transporter permease YbhS n=1 Tax=bioreactor metagenome TaxID=1076179 RepID=A0A644UE85_9ZZZZ
MKQFLSFAKKEFLHIFRDTWTMMIILVLPVIMMLLFGYAVTTEIRDTNIGILDNSRDEISNRLIDKLDESEYFSVVKVFKSNSEIDKAFRRNEISMAIVIENDFSKKLITGQNPKIQIIADASDPNHAKTLVNYASGVIAQSLMQESKANSPSSLINTELKLLYNPLMKSSYNFVPGVMGFIIIIVCAMMTSISIVRERERGSMELLLVSPVKPITIILSKVAPYFFISLINILTIFLVSYFIMGVPIKGSIFWIFLLCIVYILVSLSLGILVSTIAKTQLVALVISAIILLMPSMLLSGMMFDISSMPLILQAIAQVMPAKWFISAIRKLMIMGVDVRFVLNELLVLFSMGVVLILISLKKYKNRLE